MRDAVHICKHCSYYFLKHFFGHFFFPSPKKRLKVPQHIGSLLIISLILSPFLTVSGYIGIFPKLITPPFSLITFSFLSSAAFIISTSFSRDLACQSSKYLKLDLPLFPLFKIWKHYPSPNSSTSSFYI
jgi:hypothetical protein